MQRSDRDSEYEWKFESPFGVEYITTDLRNWIRENCELFHMEPTDRSVKRISDGFYAMKRTLEGAKVKRYKTYKGWKLISVQERTLVGMTFNRLLVIEKTDKKDERGNTIYKCECLCKEHDRNIVFVPWAHLTSGLVKSCTCLAKETAKKNGEKLVSHNREYALIEGTNVNLLRSKKIEGTTSSYKGVSWFAAQQKWKAQINFKGKTYFLGHYDVELQAAKAYEIAEKNLHGEFLKWYEETYKKNAKKKKK